MSHREDFKKGMEVLLTVEQATKGFWSQDGNESVASRNAFKEIMKRNYGDAAPALDYDGDREGVMKEVGRVSMIEAGRVTGYIGNHLDDLLRGVSEKNLAGYALAVAPESIGNASHDKSVKAHKKIGKYESMLNDAKDNYAKISDKVVEIVEKELDEKLTSKKDNKLNQYLDPKIVEAVKTHLKDLAKVSQGYGVQVLRRGNAKAREKFEDTFPERNREKAMAEYTSRNLRAQVAKGGQESLRAANAVYNMVAN
jgi:hypothetical protein